MRLEVVSEPARKVVRTGLSTGHATVGSGGPSGDPVSTPDRPASNLQGPDRLARFDVYAGVAGDVRCGAAAAAHRARGPGTR